MTTFVCAIINIISTRCYLETKDKCKDECLFMMLSWLFTQLEEHSRILETMSSPISPSPLVTILRVLCNFHLS